MRSLLFSLMLGLLTAAPARAFEVLNLNVFDQLQGSWPADFRAKRTKAFGAYVAETAPDVVVLQEAQAGEGGESADVSSFAKLYPHRRYVAEAKGADGATYGYWIGAKQKPRVWLEDGFAFPGGVPRRVQGAVWDGVGEGCIGLLSLHLSYQSSAVRSREARWLLAWVKAHQALCPHWLVVGDFNADEQDPEMRALFRGGLTSLYAKLKPTIGAFNPLRRIYGEQVRAQTIDWALGRNLAARAEVVLDEPYAGEWVSDHAAVRVHVGK